MTPKLPIIKFRNISNRRLASYPVTYGIPLPKGVLNDGAGLAMRQGTGALQPVQTRALEHHADGSIRWLLLDFEMAMEANEVATVALLRGGAKSTHPIAVEETSERIAVRTQKLEVTFSKRRFSLFESYREGGREMLADGSDIVVQDSGGKKFYASLAREAVVRVTETGPLRTVVEASGRHTAEDDSTLLDFRVRYCFGANEPGVRVSYKFTNREEPETGVTVGSIGIEVHADLGTRSTKLLRQTNSGKHWHSRPHAIRENVELMAGSSLSSEGKARYGVAAEGTVLIRNTESLRENFAEYPHYLRPGNARTDMTGGVRQVYPYLGANGEGGSALGWFFDMENQYPKGLRCERNVVGFDIWPAWAGELRVRRGQSKEHDLYLSLAARQREHAELEGIYFDHEIGGVGIWGGTASPVELTLDAEYIRGCQVLQLHRWLRYDEAKYTAIEAKLGSLGTLGTTASKGMMDFGDCVNADRSWAHNNENDSILDQIREYYRREEATMLPPALAKARHNAQVDFIAYDPDPLRTGSMPAHCPEHTDGASYPSHMWVDGLLAAHCITGEPDFAEAALAVGENLLRWQRDESGIFYADSRECGWPMLAFLRLHEFTNDVRWLAPCEEIFQWYRDKIGPDGTIKFALPHGVGTSLMAYGEFIAWRACFFYLERTGCPAVRAFLVEMLERVYLQRPRDLVMGWAVNDLFPAWAAHTLTGDDKYIEDNYPFLSYLMQREGKFPWGGVDMHFYLAELDRRGALEGFAGDSGNCTATRLHQKPR